MKLISLLIMSFSISCAVSADMDSQMATEYRGQLFSQFFIQNQKNIPNKPHAYLNYLKENLQKSTTIKEAYSFSKKITHLLTRGVKDIINLVKPKKGQDYSTYIKDMKESWVLREKFDALNVTDDQEKNDPRFIEDVVLKLPSTQDESYKGYLGVLASLSIATQEKLWNQKSTAEDLVTITKRILQQGQYHDEKSNFYIDKHLSYDNKLINDHINNEFLDIINSSKLASEATLKEILEKDTLEKDKRKDFINFQGKKLYHYPSGGKANQCGFFSLFLRDDDTDNKEKKEQDNTARHKFFRMYADYIENDPLIRHLTLVLLEMEKVPLINQHYKNELLELDIKDNPDGLMLIDLLIKNKKELQPQGYIEKEYTCLIEEERLKLTEAAREKDRKIDQIKEKYGLSTNDKCPPLENFNVLIEKTFNGENLYIIDENIKNILTKIDVAEKILKNTVKAKKVLEEYQNILKLISDTINDLTKDTQLIHIRKFIDFRNNIKNYIFNNIMYGKDTIIDNQQYEEFVKTLLANTDNIQIESSFKKFLESTIKGKNFANIATSTIKYLDVKKYFSKIDKSNINPIEIDIIKKNLEAVLFERNIEAIITNLANDIVVKNNLIQTDQQEIKGILNSIRKSYLSSYTKELKVLTETLPKVKQLGDKYGVLSYDLTDLDKKITDTEKLQTEKDEAELDQMFKKDDTSFQKEKNTLLQKINILNVNYGVEPFKQIDDKTLKINVPPTVVLESAKNNVVGALSQKDDASVQQENDKLLAINNIELPSVDINDLKDKIQILLKKIENIETLKNDLKNKDKAAFNEYKKVLGKNGYTQALSGYLDLILKNEKIEHEEKIKKTSQDIKTRHSKKLDEVMEKIKKLGYEDIVNNMQAEVQKINEVFNNTEKWKILDKKMLYLLKGNKNLQNFIYEKISKFLEQKFRETGGSYIGGYAELTMSPRGDSQHIYSPGHALDFIDAYSHIRHANVYAFISNCLIKAKYEWLEGVVPTSEDKNAHLINHTIADERAKNVYIYNAYGGHYTKLIKKDDYIAIAMAMRRAKCGQ